jgi:hypothetical protein
MTNDPRAARSIDEMWEAYKRQFDLLGDYWRLAFIEKNTNYYGEVAGKIRVLACHSSGNPGLLVELMKRTGIEPARHAHGQYPGEPGAGKLVTLEEYMNLSAGSFAVHKNRGLEHVSRRDLVSTWAQESGAAHEAWKLSPKMQLFMQLRSYKHDDVEILGRILNDITGNVVEYSVSFADEYLRQRTIETSGDERSHRQ